MRPGFKSRKRQLFFFFFFFFLIFLIYLFFVFFFLSLLLQYKFANSTLLSLLSFSYFITPYDAQASSAFSALIILSRCVYVSIMYFSSGGDGYHVIFELFVVIL